VKLLLGGGTCAWLGGVRCKSQTVDELRMQCAGTMKTASIPPVRIDPAFRKDMGQSLEGGKTLASLVETAVRNEVTRRQVQSEFIRRGMAAIHRTAAASDGVPAELVIAKLEAKLVAARRAKKA
jgi:hypothetical protein